MPTIITPPIAPGDSFARYLSYESWRAAEEHDKALAKRKKQQRNTAIVGTAIAGVVTGGLAAAALAPAAVAAEAAAVAASGATFGFSPTVAAGALSGAGIGAQLGQQVADEDYAGAIQTGAGAGLGLIKARENQRLYGFQPTNEDRAAMNALAVKSGTSLGAVSQRATAKGITVPQALRETQQAYAVQQGVLEAEAAALKEKKLFEQGMANATSANGPLEFTPDQHGIDDVWEDYNKLNAETNEFITSGGAAGRHPAEYQGRYAELQTRLNNALVGRPGPKAPTTGITPMGAPPRRVPLNTWNEIAPGFWEKTSIDSDGSYKTITKGDPIAALPWNNPGLTPEQQSTLKRHDRESRTDVDYDGRRWIRNDKGVWESEKDPIAEARAKFVHDAALKAVEAGETVDANFIADLGDAYDGAKQTSEDRKLLAEQVISFSGSEQPMSMADHAAISEQVFQTLGENPPLKVRMALDAIAINATQEAIQAATIQSAQEAATPPPGSAASAEQAGQRAAQAVKRAPEAAVQAAVSGAEAVAETTGKVMKPAGEFGAGFLNELVGYKKLDYAGRFEKYQKQNIEAGIDEVVVAIDTRTGKLAGTWDKHLVTPELIAELKARGIIIPGMEGG